MIKGMTGFGSTQILLRRVKIIIEVRSVNHRYFDAVFSLPPGLSALENKIRIVIQEYIERGRISVFLKLAQHAPPTIILNKEVVRKHLQYAHQLKKEFGIKNDLGLSDLMKLPGVVEIKETFLEADELWPSIEKCLKKALMGLNEMRKREGQSLSADIAKQLNEMSSLIENVRRRLKDILNEKKKILSEEEFKSFQKSSDINEEITRSNHYINEIKLLFKSNIAVGKKMDFVAQEMQRETNTLGSKVQDKIISSAVIALKSKIEKIREQAQNIE